MKHVHDVGNSFSLLIGKSGQLYSSRGAFGESVPPQRIQSPCNDEVWQFVAVSGEYNSPEIPLKDAPEVCRICERAPRHIVEIPVGNRRRGSSSPSSRRLRSLGTASAECEALNTANR